MSETPILDANARLHFQKQLLAVTNRIHSAANINQLVAEVSADICALFSADRFLLHLVADDDRTLVSKVMSDAGSVKDLTQPLSDQSVAGYAALARKMIHIRNARDEAEWRAINPNLRS